MLNKFLQCNTVLLYYKNSVIFNFDINLCIWQNCITFLLISLNQHAASNTFFDLKLMIKE